MWYCEDNYFLAKSLYQNAFNVKCCFCSHWSSALNCWHISIVWKQSELLTFELIAEWNSELRSVIQQWNSLKSHIHSPWLKVSSKSNPSKEEKDFPSCVNLLSEWVSVGSDLSIQLEKQTKAGLTLARVRLAGLNKHIKVVQ